MMYRNMNLLICCIFCLLQVVCLPVSAQEHEVVNPDLVFDKYIEANNLRGIPQETQKLHIELLSQSIDAEKKEVELCVDGPYKFSTQDRDWGSYATNLGVDTGDNSCISSCQGNSHYYICAQLGEGDIVVFQTQNGIDWEYVIIDRDFDLKIPDIDAGDGYLFISCSYLDDKHPAIFCSTYPDDISDWGVLRYWTGTTKIRTTSVAAISRYHVCFGFHVYGEDDIHLYHSINNSAFTKSLAYNPYSTTQRDIDLDGGSGAGTSYIYSAYKYYDTALNKYQGRVCVYELDSTSLTMTMSEGVAWSDTSTNENLTIHGDDDKFTIAYQYFEASIHKIYARTYANYGESKTSLGHVADHTASDMYPRVFHDPVTDWKYFVFLRMAGGGDVYTSVIDSDHTWTTSEEKIPDSTTSLHRYRGVCTLHFGTNGQDRQLIAWIDERDTYDNVYYSFEMPPNEECPGEIIDISSWVAGDGSHIEVSGDLNYATDDIDEILEVGCWSGASTSEKVYRITAPADLNLQVYLTSDFDTKMAIVSPCPNGSTTCLFNDDYTSKNAGFADVPIQAGITYSIIVSGNSVKGIYSLHIFENSSCNELGCKINMPSDDFAAGDEFYCHLVICNPDSTTYDNVPVFLILDVYGAYFFAPDFSDFNYYTETIPQGETLISPLGTFNWPSGAGTATGIIWHAAMTNQEMTDLFGAYGFYEFGWH
ncbi:hypothetical protein K8T06_16185 [bacterium]|nr:hypothetical protein [bacterium]